MFLKSKILKNVDIIFVLFLVLVTQGNIQLKILGTIFILLVRFKAIHKISYFSKFYVLIIFIHLIYGLFNIFVHDVYYTPSYIFVLIFWIISYVIFTNIAFFIEKASIEKIDQTINFFFRICVSVIILQYLTTAISFHSINPYSVSAAAGDKMKSIFSNSSVSMIIMSFFFLSFAFRRKWSSATISFICLLMATYMSGTVIFLATVLIGIFFFSKFKLIYKIYFLLFAFIFSTLFLYVSPSNVDYAMGYINRIIENGDDTPYKIKSFWQTIEYWTSSFKSFVFGAGGGNFSSRVAFITSGDYVSWFPDSWIYMSDEFQKYHFDIWTYDFNNPWDDRNNTANQPFSFYNQIIGEYGLLGLLIFVFFYLKVIFNRWNKITYSKVMLVTVAGYFVLDYWFEYFSVMVIFELLLMLDVKQSITEKKVYC